MEFIPEVVQVIPFEDYTVDVYFSDGKIVRYDALPISNEGVFKALQDKGFFMQRCTVMNGSLAWDVSGNMDESTCLDLDPEMLHDLPGVEERIA